MEPTSEQELKQLLEEGRITEEEYRELLEAIRQKETSKLTATETSHSRPPIDYRKIVSLSIIIGVVLPVTMALVIKFIFDIGMFDSMVVIWIVTILVLLVINGIVWLRRKNS